MKTHLRFERRLVNDYLTTVLTHVKVTDEDGRYVAFAQHSDALVAYLSTLTVEVPADLLVWKGKAS